MGEQPQSRNEFVILALLVERPAHGFALAKELSAGSDLGRILTVRRPLVYRALDRVVAADLATPVHTEPGQAGPTRTVYRPTPSGTRAVSDWLDTPVAHVRDLRVEFLVKLRLLERRNLGIAKLVADQRAELAETVEGLLGATEADVVDLWRYFNARAADAYLEELANRNR